MSKTFSNLILLFTITNSYLRFNNVTAQIKGDANCLVEIANKCEHCKIIHHHQTYKYIGRIRGCRYDAFNTEWHLDYYNDKNRTKESLHKTVQLNSFQNKLVYVIKEYSLDYGYFTVITFLAIRKSDSQTFLATTNVEVYPKNPVISFKYGTEQWVEPTESFPVEVVDMIKSFSIAWKTTRCTVIERECPNFLEENGISQGQCPKNVTLNMPTGATKRTMAGVHKCLSTLRFECTSTMAIATPVYKHSVKNYSKLRVKAEIRCVSNCGFIKDYRPAYPGRETVLKLVCLDYCDDLKGRKGKWSVLQKTGAVSGTKRSGYSLTIPKNDTDFRGFIEIKYMIGTSGIGSTVVYRAAKYKKMTCRTDPERGFVILTDFEVLCEHGEKLNIIPKKYFLYQMEDATTKGEMLATDKNPCFRTVVGLGKEITSVTFKVDGYDETENPFESHVLEVPIRSTPMNNETLNKALNRLKFASENGDNDFAVNLAASIARELDRADVTETQRSNARKYILQKLATFASSDEMSADHLLILETIIGTFLKEKLIGRLAQFCKQMTKKLRVKSADLEKEHMIEVARFLSNCGKKVHNYVAEEKTQKRKKEDAVSSKRKAIPIEDKYLSEDYPDYDQIMVTSLEKDALEIMVKSTAALGGNLKTGESFIDNGTIPKVMVTRALCHRSTGKRLDLETVGLRILKGVEPCTQNAITISLIVFNKTATSTTPVVSVTFFSGNDIHRPKKGVVFALLMPIEKLEEKLGSFVSHSLGKAEEAPYQLICYRAKILHYEGVVVKFSDISPKVQVILAFNRRPSHSEFPDNAKILDSKKFQTYIYTMSSSPEDRFFYTCVLPYSSRKASQENTSASYSAAFYRTACNYMKGRTWVVADCKTKIIFDKQAPMLRCICTHTTLFVGDVSSLETHPNRLDKVNVGAKYFVNWVVFGHVLFVFFMYCMFLIRLLEKEQVVDKESLVFLSDNRKNDRFAYVIIVETGSVHHSGTTSNVGIKLYGFDSKSDPHILNYPDPEKKLLQRYSVDWLVLTTMRPLGPIKYIHIWFDGIGFRPHWKCETIRILDLQTRTEQHFKIDKWFSLGMHEGVRELYVRPDNAVMMDTDVKTKLRKYFRFYMGPEHTWNVFLTSRESELSYPQRLTVLLSMILTVYFVCFICLTQPKLTLSDEYSYEFIRMQWQLMYIPLVAALGAALIHFPIIFYFKNASEPPTVNSLWMAEKKFSGNRTNLLLILLYVWIFLLMSYLLVYGFWMTLYTSLYWIVFSVIAILILVVVLENMYLLCYNVIKATRIGATKIHYFYKRIIAEVEDQRNFVYKIFGENLMRPYFLKHYKVMRGYEFLSMKLHESLRLSLQYRAVDLLLLIIFITILLYLTISHMDFLFNVSNMNLQKLFISCKHNLSFCIKKIKEPDDIYTYLNDTVLPKVHALYWYESANLNNPAMIIDNCNKLLGVVRLRQQRGDQLCARHFIFTAYNWPCFNNYTIFDTWEKTTATFASSVMGKLGVYSGGGYIATLGRNWRNSVQRLDYLRSVEWININTKVLFIEFWMYNVNCNIFNAVVITIEKHFSGRYLHGASISVNRLVYTGLQHQVSLFLGSLLRLMLILMTYRLIKRWRRSKKDCVTIFWNIIDLCLIILTTVFSILEFVIDKEAEILVHVATANHNEYIPFDGITFLTKLHQHFAAAIISVASLRLWNYLRFGTIFRVAERCCVKSFISIYSIILQHALLIMMCSLLLHLVFGSVLEQVGTVVDSIGIMITLSLDKRFGMVHLSEFAKQSHVCFILFALLTTMFFILNHLYASTILTNWKASKIYFSGSKEYSMKSYLVEEKDYYMEIVKGHLRAVRLRGGEDIEFTDNEFVTPKGFHKRYANMKALTTTQILYMKAISIAIIKLYLKHFKPKVDLDKILRRLAVVLIKLRIEENSREDSERMIFFPVKDRIGKQYTFVENYRLLQMEAIVKQLLKPEEESEPLVITSDSLYKQILHLKVVADTIRDIVLNIQLTSDEQLDDND